MKDKMNSPGICTKEGWEELAAAWKPHKFIDIIIIAWGQRISHEKYRNLLNRISDNVYKLKKDNDVLKTIKVLRNFTKRWWMSFLVGH